MVSPTSKSTRIALGRRDGWRCNYCDVRFIPEDGPDLLTCVPSPGCYCECDGYPHLLDDVCPNEVEWRLPDGYENPSVDHVTPRARGGSNELDNLVLACLWCNARKGKRLLGEMPDHWWTAKPLREAPKLRAHSEGMLRSKLHELEVHRRRSLPVRPLPRIRARGNECAVFDPLRLYGMRASADRWWGPDWVVDDADWVDWEKEGWRELVVTDPFAPVGVPGGQS